MRRKYSKWILALKRPELSLYEKRRINVQRNKSVLESLFPPEENFKLCSVHKAHRLEHRSKHVGSA